MTTTFDPADFNRQIIEEFRANKGKVGGLFEGATLVLMTTVGAKSGVKRVSPVASFFPEGDRIIVIASNGGSANHPAWYHNLLADPELSVEVGADEYKATATVIEGDERDEIFAKVVAVAPNFGEYQAKTERKIPVVALNRKN
jgi:deazaflavin-dependent oxidoreductase (nitroreductase family)